MRERFSQRDEASSIAGTQEEQFFFSVSLNAQPIGSFNIHNLDYRWLRSEEGGKYVVEI